MIKFKFSLIVILFAFAATTFASYSPTKVQAALKKMYPTATDIAWSEDGGYYCADFVQDGFEKNVWFNAQGQWVMTQTELGSTDRVPDAVYNAYAASAYCDWGVLDVTLVEFPKWEPIYTIEVGQSNVDIKYQLFYAPNGELLRTRNVTDLDDILGPDTFL